MKKVNVREHLKKEKRRAVQTAAQTPGTGAPALHRHEAHTLLTYSTFTAATNTVSKTEVIVNKLQESFLNPEILSKLICNSQKVQSMAYLINAASLV